MRRRVFLALSAGAAGAAALGRVYRAQARPRASARVVIAGGGFAGASCALALRRLNPAIDVTLVDPDMRYVTCPMSNGALVGLRSLKSLVVSRHGLERAGVVVLRGRIEALDVERRRARLSGGAEIDYARLVMAAGIRFLWGQPQGYDAAAAEAMPHAWVAGVQTEILAAQLRAIRNGGVVAISVPAGPMRCPPGPFERASLIAGYLKENKPRCKVLIFDANNHFPRQDVFTDAWQALTPGMIEWIPVVEGGAVVRVEPAKMILHTSRDMHRVDVANIIPPQAPAALAVQAGLASDHGWCPVQPQTFESSMIPHVHVIGDACIADPMPKSASAAHSQAKQCALAIVASLEGREPPAPEFESVCYSLLGRGSALSIHGRFAVTDGAIQELPGRADTGSARFGQDPALFAQEARNAEDWYRSIVLDSFGA